MKELLNKTMLILLLFGCAEKKQVSNLQTNYYTCSMHPQIMKEEPGNCPICGMTLIKVNKNKSDSSNLITLTEQQIQLANITFDTIMTGDFKNEIQLPAIVAVDQQENNTQSSRVPGRITKLYYKNVGDQVKKGAKLYDLYSEELNNDKQEYKLTLENAATFKSASVNFSEVILNAKNKLKLAGLTEQQIHEVASSKNVSTLTTFYSHISGTIRNLSVQEGQTIAEGSTIEEVANLNDLWAEAQVYPSQINSIASYQKAIVTIDNMPDFSFSGKIDFINPEINTGTRLMLIRIKIPVKNVLLRPGIPAIVHLQHPSSRIITVPSDAVLRNNQQASVWIRKGVNSFENRMVTIGSEQNDFIEIKSGLTNGDVIVSTGAYLLNSEYIFKKGSTPMDGMKM